MGGGPLHERPSSRDTALAGGARNRSCSMGQPTYRAVLAHAAPPGWR